MKCTKKTTATLLTFVLLAATDTLWAQSDDEVLPMPSDEQLTEDKAKEQAADETDAIIDNIDLSVEDDELTKTIEPSEKIEKTVSEQEDDGIWIEKFQIIPKTLHSLPEYVPGLAGRDWIFFGRAEEEYADFSSGILSDDSGFKFRSLRIGLFKVFDNRTTIKLEVDLTDGDSNWTDLYVRFNTNLGLFTVGNQKISQTLVNQTSRLARTFMEEALPAEAFGLGRRLGVGWDGHKNKLGGHLTVFGADVNGGDSGDIGFGGRVYFNPAKTKFSLFHIGASAVYEKMNHEARFRAHPETRVTDTRLVDTQNDKGVNNQTILGLELAVAQDSYSLRGEYFVAQWDRSSRSDPKFDGYYVQANWAITGETFQYKQGKFLRLRPKGKWGAWELAARYSRVDLNDIDVQGGKENNTTLGLNWYSPGNRFRIMSNVIFVDADNQAGNKDTTISQIRAQLNW
jgi:phosphate-selective porin OprO and OprP